MISNTILLVYKTHTFIGLSARSHIHTFGSSTKSVLNPEGKLAKKMVSIINQTDNFNGNIDDILMVDNVGARSKYPS